MRNIAFVVLLVGGIASWSARDVPGAEEDRFDEAIQRYRMGTLTIEAPSGTPVRVEQQRHAFWFGAAISSHLFWTNADPREAARYRQVFLENFNAGVLENALKWNQMERHPGEVDHTTVDAILAWADEHDLPLRGHCIFWGVPSRVPPWQKVLNDDQLRGVLRNRAVSIGRDYRGRFAEYDLNNEMFHANYYADRLGDSITREMADWVREGDPEAVLYVNDYDILTGRRVTDYAAHIRKLQTQGVRLGGIGVQGHSHGQSFDPLALEHSLAALAELGLPIRVTEFNFPGQRSASLRDRGRKLTKAEEEAKAKALVEYYRICFAQPAVQGILMWGFWEGTNWIPVSSLYRRDWSPTPAAKAYRELVFERWWTRWKGMVPPSGRLEIPAFLGTHRVWVGEDERVVDLDDPQVPRVVHAQ